MHTVAGSLVYSGQKPTRKRIGSHPEPAPLDRQPAVVSLNAQNCILDLSDWEISLGAVDSQKTHTSSGTWV